MDDLQFRRSIYADPKTQDTDVIAAKNADPSRAQFANEIEQLDNRIADALNVPVPDELCNKLILRQAMASHQQHKRKKRIHLALAASVAFAIGLTVNMLQFSSAYDDIGDYALAHVYHEQGVFSNTSDNRVSLASLNTKMTAFNGSFSGQIGKLISADYCRFDGIKSLHLVFQGQQSPVNVFIVPERSEVALAKLFEDNSYHGTSLKLGDNHVVVVGDKQEPIQQWQQNLDQNTIWSI